MNVLVFHFTGNYIVCSAVHTGQYCDNPVVIMVVRELCEFARVVCKYKMAANDLAKVVIVGVKASTGH